MSGEKAKINNSERSPKFSHKLQTLTCARLKILARVGAKVGGLVSSSKTD